MVKLYYTPTSCGAASYLAASIAGLNIDSETVDLGTHKTASGADFYAINPKGNVPTLVLDDGTILNEGAATLQYIADQAPASGLAPAWGTKERYLLIQALNWVASELHTSIGGLFNPTLNEEGKNALKARSAQKLTYAETHLFTNDYLVGNTLSVADLYMYIVLSWSGYVGVEFTAEKYPKVKAFYDRVVAHPGVVAGYAAMKK